MKDANYLKILEMAKRNFRAFQTFWIIWQHAIFFYDINLVLDINCEKYTQV